MLCALRAHSGSGSDLPFSLTAKSAGDGGVSNHQRACFGRGKNALYKTFKKKLSSAQGGRSGFFHTRDLDLRTGEHTVDPKSQFRGRPCAPRVDGEATTLGVLRPSGCRRGGRRSQKPRRPRVPVRRRLQRPHFPGWGCRSAKPRPRGRRRARRARGLGGSGVPSPQELRAPGRRWNPGAGCAPRSREAARKERGGLRALEPVPIPRRPKMRRTQGSRRRHSGPSAGLRASDRPGSAPRGETAPAPRTRPPTGSRIPAGSPPRTRPQASGSCPNPERRTRRRGAAAHPSSIAEPRAQTCGRAGPSPAEDLS